MTRCLRHATARIFCVLGAWGLLAVPTSGQKQPPPYYSVQLSASVQEAPPSITLSWVPMTDAVSYEISRLRTSGWQRVAQLSSNVVSWTDTNVAPGTLYEYQVIKQTSANYRGTGYISSGIRTPYPDDRGKVVLVVENSVAGALSLELDRFEQDLIGDGWSVIRRSVSMNDSPPAIKSIIQSVYEADPANVRAVVLFGHVPVPYSGDIAPDGHANHRGAWPADVYYGDMDGSWTDVSVNNRTAEREVNRNVPGDGKFDQSVIPSAVELMVGRVDLHNMTCFANKTPSRSEIDLLRQYLDKNNRYRHGLMEVDRRAIICDNFTDKGRDPIGGSAWRNFPALVGASNIVEVPWDGFFPSATESNYMWSFASGGGSYYYAMGVGTSDDFALHDVNIVFTMFMGSYFGDWNNESNFLRASLGSGNVLAATYSGFPHYLYFPMGMGEPIGAGIRLTQNNLSGTLYPPWQQGQGQVHVGLMGDPTLRLYAVRPPANLSITTSPGTARLTWSPSPDPEIEGYHVYRATNMAGPFNRVSAGLVTGTSFTNTPGSGTFVYMVRAVKLEQSPSGTYLNPSQGVFASATVPGPLTSQQEPLLLSILQNPAGQITLRISGDPGQHFRVESSPDLQAWSLATTGQVTLSPNEIALGTAQDEGQKFLRAVKVP